MEKKPKYKDNNLDKNGRIINCTTKDCNEPAFEFGKCLEHSKNHMIDDLPTHNNYLLTQQLWTSLKNPSRDENNGRTIYNMD